MATLVNWDRTQTWTPSAVHRPHSEDDVVRIVRRAAESGTRVKPLGSVLSWSDAIDVPGEAVLFDRMSDVVAVDRDQRTITVQAGALLSEVNEALAANGLAFDNLGSIMMQTAAGYVGTGTHGTGGRTRILSAYLRHLRLVDGAGEVHELDAEREPELFSAARVNLGCLGLVTELTFDCVPAYDVEERLELVDFDRALADLQATVDGHDYVKLWWFPYTNQVQVYTFDRTEAPRTGFELTRVLDESGVSGVAFTGLLALTRALPELTPFIMRTSQRVHFHSRRRVDRSDRVTKYPGSVPRHQETEYAFPIEHAATTIERMREMIHAARYRVNFLVEVRFVAADDIQLSPASGRDSCYLGAYVASRDWARRYHAEFEELIRDVQGRPHWGKSFSRTAAELRELYPGYDGFDQLRRRCDPHGLFRNSFVDRVFPAAEDDAG